MSVFHKQTLASLLCYEPSVLYAEISDSSFPLFFSGINKELTGLQVPKSPP